MGSLLPTVAGRAYSAPAATGVNGAYAMKIYGYSSGNEEQLLELREATIAAAPERLREIAKFIQSCADEIEDRQGQWNHAHYEEFSESVSDNFPQLVVLYSEHE